MAPYLQRTRLAMSSNKVILTIVGLFVSGSALTVAVIIALFVLYPTSSATPSATRALDLTPTSGGLSFDYKWRKDGFNTLMTVDFTFTNRSAKPVKDITVTCTHYAPSGTQIDSNTRTIYEAVPANSTKSVKDFDMGFIHSQVSSTVCKIDDFET